MSRNENSHKKVFVGMSGGVDSSVAALLLKQQGFDVVGAFIRGYNIDGCADRDAEDARRVAQKIGIPFYVFDLEKEYKERVVDYMVRGYAEGVTPNPDVMCNREIKFGLFLQRALSLGAHYVATGHYVKLMKSDTQHLAIARDTGKDQSYFLWTLTTHELSHCIFPLGELEKTEVREIARTAGLPTAEKKDSQGICFLGMFDVKEFLSTHIRTEKGVVRDVHGTIIGEHDGAALYTIGQRHGFRLLGGVKRLTPAHPYYVASKNVRSNELVVVEGNEDPLLFRNEVKLVEVNTAMSVYDGLSVMARVRYRQPLSPATLHIEEENGVKCYSLRFAKPQKFVAEGQSAVFYDPAGGLVGGGIIV